MDPSEHERKSSLERTESLPAYLKEDDLLRRLRRIEGQIRGLEAMVGRQAVCRDILTQVSAVQGALAKVARMVEACGMAEHLMKLDPEATWDLDAVRVIIDRTVAGQS